MQLDTTVTYTGIPQDEWKKAKIPNKTFNGPKTPQAAKNASNACKHKSTFITILLLFGFSSALLIPLLISSFDVDSFPQDSSTSFPNKGVINPSTIGGKSSTSKPSRKVTSTPSKKVTDKFKVTKGVPHSKIITTKSPHKVPGTFKSTFVTTRASTIVKPKTTIIHSMSSPAETRPTSTHSSSNSSFTVKTEDQEKLSGSSNTSSIISQIIDVIYNNGNGTSGPGSDKDLELRIKELLNSQPSLEVIIFGIVAIFFGLIFLLVGMSCIHQRRKARNRRVKFQDVVTDLQSQDKVVLLTSDLSEEE